MVQIIFILHRFISEWIGRNGYKVRMSDANKALPSNRTEHG